MNKKGPPRNLEGLFVRRRNPLRLPRLVISF